MARYRWYDEEYSITTIITIPDTGECRIETRHAGHLVHEGRIDRDMAKSAVEKYGYEEINERRSFQKIKKAFKRVDLSSRGTDEEYARVTAGEIVDTYHRNGVSSC